MMNSYGGEIGAIGSDTEDAVELILVELDPVDPVMGDVDIDGEDVVTGTGDGHHALGRVLQRIAARQAQLRHDGERFVRDAAGVSVFA